MERVGERKGGDLQREKKKKVIHLLSWKKGGCMRREGGGGLELASITLSPSHPFHFEKAKGLKKRKRKGGGCTTGTFALSGCPGRKRKKGKGTVKKKEKVLKQTFPSHGDREKWGEGGEEKHPWMTLPPARRRKGRGGWT